jgi:hypothetical protein
MSKKRSAPPADDIDTITRQALAELQRSASAKPVPNKLDCARVYERVVEEHRGALVPGMIDLIEQRIAQAAGISPRTLRRRVEILKAPKAVQIAFEAGRISQEEAQRIAKLDKQQQSALAKQLGEGKPLADVVAELAPQVPVNPFRTVYRLCTAMERARAQLDNGQLDRLIFGGPQLIPRLLAGRELTDRILAHLQSGTGFKCGVTKMKRAMTRRRPR